MQPAEDGIRFEGARANAKFSTRSFTLPDRDLALQAPVPTANRLFAKLAGAVRVIVILWLAGAPERTAGAEVEMLLSADYQWGAVPEVPHSAPPAGLAFSRKRYDASDAVEWQVRLRAPTEGSPMYDDLRSADLRVRFPTDQPVALHWNKGSHSEGSDFQPKVETLEAGRKRVLESFGGRSSDGVLPYFNLGQPGGGFVVAVGWSGDWRVSFEALSGGRVRIAGGPRRSHFRLPAGETLRLPSVLVMAYRGDWVDGQNQFRRLMLRHFTPTNHSPMELMPVAASVHGMIGFNDTGETNLLSLATDLAALKLPIDTFWLDAGWNEGGFPRGQGNPQPDPHRFPRGLGPIGDGVRSNGMRFLVWFEPERAMRGTWLEREHAPWLLQPSGTPEDLRYQEKDGFRLLDLGRLEARAWAVDSVSQQVRDAGIAIYRQDFNLYPGFFWSTEEGPEAVGLRELRYVNGLYEFLDELVRRHPGLILDNCASGGRRLDFEMMRRCVALWRSDSCWDAKTFPRNVQAMTYGLSQWLPLHGLGAAATDDLALRSGMGACASFAINYRDPAAVAALRRHLDRYGAIRDLFTRDFYPLTPWTENTGEVLAFQFHDPVSGRGVVQVFRGPTLEPMSLRVKLRGLSSGSKFRVFDWDQPGKSSEYLGSRLTEQGLPVTFGTESSALVSTYEVVTDLP
ncbi:MAG: alpha-galactosidase [Verrucomicrobiales bacterium]|nr:alpha-galactosidase [Verrucomicrobiales bacterium]